MSPPSSDPDDRGCDCNCYLGFLSLSHPLHTICHVATRVVLLKDIILSNVKCLQ